MTERIGGYEFAKGWKLPKIQIPGLGGNHNDRPQKVTVERPPPSSRKTDEEKKWHRTHPIGKG